MLIFLIKTLAKIINNTENVSKEWVHKLPFSCIKMLVYSHSPFLAITFYNRFTHFLRQTQVNLISQAMLDKVEKELNNRPRNCLKFNSPSEILKEEKR